MPLSIEFPQQSTLQPDRRLRRSSRNSWRFTWRLSFYTASFIAEIVRAGIMGVSKGQTEAAAALGLRSGPTLRLVVVPQALRIIIPPLTSQYLNLTKNSSLAIAVGYADLVAIGGTILNQTGQADRGRRDLDGRLSRPQPGHLGVHELVQRQVALVER